MESEVEEYDTIIAGPIEGAPTGVYVEAFKDHGQGLVVVLVDAALGQRIALNEESLRGRIANLRANGIETATEDLALVEMIRRKKLPDFGFAHDAATSASAAAEAP